MNDKQYRVLLDLMMVSDPWPLNKADHIRFLSLMLNEAKLRGYDDEIQAFHYFLVANKKSMPKKARLVTASDGQGGTVDLKVIPKKAVKRKPRNIKK